MNRFATSAVCCLLSAVLHAQSITNTPKGIVVAHDGAIELHSDHLLWRANGVANPALVVADDDTAAAIDPLANQVAVVDLKSGRSSIEKTGETPVDALFLGRELYILNRDSRTLQRGKATIDLAADPAFLRESHGMLYIYSRLSGVLQEIGTNPFAIRRSLNVAPFASDMALDPSYAYLTYPRAGKVATIDLAKLAPFGEQKIGAVPVGVAVMSHTIAIADPSAKRVWMIEGAQSFGQAVARGFLRGLLGIGLHSNRASQFPEGVDRVVMSGSIRLAYDSATGTLYRFTSSSATPIAQRIAPHAFAITERGVAWWDGTALRLHKATAVEHD